MLAVKEVSSLADNGLDGPDLSSRSFIKSAVAAGCMPSNTGALRRMIAGYKSEEAAVKDKSFEQNTEDALSVMEQ